jgi:hypothetical protein
MRYLKQHLSLQNDILEGLSLATEIRSSKTVFIQSRSLNDVDIQTFNYSPAAYGLLALNHSPCFQRRSGPEKPIPIAMNARTEFPQP